MATSETRNGPLRERLTTSGGMLAPFRYPAFRAIWSANLFSQLGSMIQSVGAAWLMTELTRSHTLVAAVQASVSLPILLFAVVAGAIADNFDRRRVMLASQWGMLVVSAALAVLTYLGKIGPWSLLAFTLAVGTGTALNGPAWQASVRAQVGARDLPAAISLNTIAFNLARSVGPALGGILISLASVSAAFAINALSYVALIVVLLRWHPEVPPPVRGPVLRSIGEGVRFCLRSDPLRRILLRGLSVGIGASAFQSLLPSLVRDGMHGTELDYGLVLGAFGFGSIVGALIVAPVRRRFGTELTVTVGILMVALATPIVGHAVSVWPIMPFSFLAGMGWVAIMTTLNVAMQLRSPEAILGRCLAIYQAISIGGMALGAWVWGALSDRAGLTFATEAAGLWLVGTLIVLRLFAPMPQPHEGRVVAP